MFTTAGLIIAQYGKQAKCQSTVEWMDTFIVYLYENALCVFILEHHTAMRITPNNYTQHCG